MPDDSLPEIKIKQSQLTKTFIFKATYNELLNLPRERFRDSALLVFLQCEKRDFSGSVDVGRVNGLESKLLRPLLFPQDKRMSSNREESKICMMTPEADNIELASE